jgi:hypothetical protein
MTCSNEQLDFVGDRRHAEPHEIERLLQRRDPFGRRPSPEVEPVARLVGVRFELRHRTVVDKCEGASALQGNDGWNNQR